MPLIHLETFIKAPVQVVFDVSRSVDLHKASMKHHDEEVIDGIGNGLMKEGDTVTWRAKHFFKRRTLKVQLTEWDAPFFFADEMLEGDFKMMRHEHRFTSLDNGTLMTDDFPFKTPFGIAGAFVNALFLQKYMTNLLQRRNQEIKCVAEPERRNVFL